MIRRDSFSSAVPTAIDLGDEVDTEDEMTDVRSAGPDDDEPASRLPPDEAPRAPRRPLADDPPPSAGTAPRDAQERFDLSAVATTDIQAELAAREREAHKLMAEKARLLSRVARLDREIARLSGSDDGAPRLTALPASPRSDLSDLPLGDAIARLFGIGDEFSPAAVEERLTERGYHSRVANLRTAVNQVLSKEVRFKRVARGLYVRTG